MCDSPAGLAVWGTLCGYSGDQRVVCDLLCLAWSDIGQVASPFG